METRHPSNPRLRSPEPQTMVQLEEQELSKTPTGTQAVQHEGRWALKYPLGEIDIGPVTHVVDVTLSDPSQLREWAAWIDTANGVALSKCEAELARARQIMRQVLGYVGNPKVDPLAAMLETAELLEGFFRNFPGDI